MKTYSMTIDSLRMDHFVTLSAKLIGLLNVLASVLMMRTFAELFHTGMIWTHAQVDYTVGIVVYNPVVYSLALLLHISIAGCLLAPRRFLDKHLALRIAFYFLSLVYLWIFWINTMNLLSAESLTNRATIHLTLAVFLTTTLSLYAWASHRAGRNSSAD